MTEYMRLKLLESAKNRRYYLKHRSQILEYKKRYYRENREVCCQRNRDYRRAVTA